MASAVKENLEENEKTRTRCFQSPTKIAHHHDGENDRDEEKNDCDCSYKFRQPLRGLARA